MRENARMKKVLSILLCFCMIIGHFSMSVYAEDSTPATDEAVEAVQALIDALPSEVTAENLEDVKAQLTAIDQAKLTLTEEQKDRVDFTGYNAAISAINILEGQAGAEIPVITMQVFVKTPEGTHITLEVEPEDTIADVKAKIQDKNGIPTHKQQLTYSGKTLEDSETLQDCAIPKDAMLELAIIEEESYNLWVGGVEVTSFNTSGEGWSYDHSTQTLTLNGAAITGNHNDAAIYAVNPLNIVLSGSNTISGYYYGIYSVSSVNISGEGSLSATGHWDGIQAHGDVTINGGTVTFTGEANFGIKAEGQTLTINGGYVIAKGGVTGAGVFANSIDLGSSAHVKVTHGSDAVWGDLRSSDGLCRTSVDGTFTDTIAASGPYFEYVGASDMLTYTRIDEQQHAVSCGHDTFYYEAHKYENGVCVCEAEDPMYGCDFIVTGDASYYSWDKTNKVLTITGGNVTVSNKDGNTSTTHRIYICGTANVTLDGVNITSTTGAPVEIRDYSDTNVTLNLSGNNTLISQTTDKAAIHKTRGQQATSSDAATLTINGSGSLTAIGGKNAAGIGSGGYRGDVHNIIINDGIISATGTGYAAGIGSSDDGSTWNITINGGNITASGDPGIGANTTIWEGMKDAAITGGMVITNSYKGSAPTGGLVSTDGGKTYTVYSNYTLSQDLTIAADGKLTVAEGVELTVAEGITLTNEGILVNDGTISGSIANEGAIYNKGSLPENVGGVVYEQYVTVNNGSGTDNYAAGITVTIKANAPETGKMFTGWTVELGTVTLADNNAETTFTMPEGCVIVTANYAAILATVTDTNGNVTYYSDANTAQRDWYTSGGTLTLYTDNFPLDSYNIPQNGVLDLNGHSVDAFILPLRSTATIKNGTFLLSLRALIENGAVVTFENVTVRKNDPWPEEVEIINNGTIVDAGLILDGVSISGGTVRTVLTEDRVTLADIPDGGYTYDGTAHEPGVKCGENALVKGTDYTVTFRHSAGDNSTVNAGTVTMTITGMGNYSGTVTKTYTISKAPAVCTAPTANKLTYNGAAQTLIAAGSTNHGIMKYSLSETGPYREELPKAAAAGTYKVWYTVEGDTNHTDGDISYIEVTISKADPGIGFVTAGVVENTLETSAIALTRANTNMEGTLIVDAGQTLVLGRNEIHYTFVPLDTANYKSVTGSVTVTVVDTIAPTGTVTVSTKSWAEFLNNITFGLFFKETQTVSVTASDDLSGVAKIEYIESSISMDLAAVQAATQWTEVKNGSVSVTLEDAKRFIYYIRITDKSGNVAYLSSDGAEYDTSAPVIAGVDHGVTYYTTQIVTVTDKNIGTITLNGEAVTGAITLEGDKEATYTIVATDKADNSSTVTVTMKPIRTLTEATEGLTQGNVTSADAPALEELVEKLDELLADEDVSDAGERETLEQHKHIAESLLQTIEDTAAEQIAVTEKTAAFDKDTVKSTDKAELEELAEDIDALLDTDHLTQEERTALETILEQVKDMIDAIDNTATDSKIAADTVDAHDPAAVTSKDKAVIETALDAIESLLETRHLTDAEREALEDAKADAEALLDAIEKAENAANTDNTTKVEDVTSGNVALDDKSDLEKAKADLEKALEGNSGNYTAEEKKAIQDEIKRINGALEVIEKVEAVENSVSDLPTTVEPDDEETVAKIEKAKKAYDGLTDHEKSLVDQKTKEKLESLTAAAVAYDIIKGDVSKWTKGDGSVVFTANGPLSKFTGIQIDGQPVDAKHYEVKSGSTIIILKASYLEALAVGEHTITVVYIDGETSGTFNVQDKSTAPTTGDDSNILLWTTTLFVSVAAMAVLAIVHKKFAYKPKYSK